jgi:hypothetical protein
MTERKPLQLEQPDARLERTLRILDRAVSIGLWALLPFGVWAIWAVCR